MVDNNTSKIEQIFCEECETDITEDRFDNDLCEKCHEQFYCECGQRLEDSYGSPGDGFCIRCR